MVFFLVCSAAYTVYTDPDCNLDCVMELVVAVVVVVTGGGDGNVVVVMVVAFQQ